MKKEIEKTEPFYEEEIIKPKKQEKKEIIDEEEIEINNKKQQQDYSKLIEELPELKADLDYLAITKKLENAETLSIQEEKFKATYEEAKIKEQEYALAQETQAQQEAEKQKNQELQLQINKEYEEYKQDNIKGIVVHNSEKSLHLEGSDNFLKVAMTWLQFKKTKKKGGKIFVKVARPKKVSIEWTNEDIRFVEFWSKNERGEKVKEVSRVNEYMYTFMGTSIPVIFAVQGYAVAYDFYSHMKKDLSSEFVSGLVMEAYNLGLKDGTVLKDGQEKKSGLLGTLTEYMPLILIVGLLVIGFMMYTLYGEMATLYKAVTALQEQIAITGALVVR